MGTGIALGCDYPTAHLIISESMPSRIRGRMVLGAFDFQAIGGLAGTAIGFMILFENSDITAWRWMYASTILLAAPVIIGRFFVVQSPCWLVFRGRIAEAEAETRRLLLRNPPYPKEITLYRPHDHDKAHLREKAAWSALFTGKNRDRTILASVPWFLQDLSTYGIGIFTPTVLATIIGAGIAHPRNTAELIQGDILATRGAAFIDLLLIVGIAFAVVLADRVGRIRLQVMGFIGCAVGLLRAALSLRVGGTLSMVLLFAVHAVQLHDQYRAQFDDLSDRGRGISDFHARSGRRLCCVICQDRRGAHRVPVPDSAQGHRHATAAVDPGWNEPAWRSRYAPLRHRNQGDQPGED